MIDFVGDSRLLEKADVVICFLDYQPYIYKNRYSEVLGKTEIKRLGELLKFCQQELKRAGKKKK
jgi:hypothetical protein